MNELELTAKIGGLEDLCKALQRAAEARGARIELLEKALQCVAACPHCTGCAGLAKTAIGAEDDDG